MSSQSSLKEAETALPESPVRLNIGGEIYITTKETLAKHPQSRLGQLNEEDPNYFKEPDEYYFDRNQMLFDFILDYYRTGCLHIPKDMCVSRLRSELEFWDLPQECLAECCKEDIDEMEMKEEKLKELEEAFSMEVTTPAHERGCLSYTKHCVYTFLENPKSSTYALIWSVFYTICIVASLMLMVLETDDYFRQPFTEDIKSLLGISHLNMTEVTMVLNATFAISPQKLFYMNSIVCFPMYIVDLTLNFFFSIEIIIRSIASPSKKKHFTSFVVLCEIVSVSANWTAALILWLYPELLLSGTGARWLFWIYSFRNLRVFRLFKLARFSIGLRVFTLALKDSLKELGLLVLVILISMVIFASSIFYAEFESPTSQFENIPLGLWWALITMTTVGYGDLAPSSIIGYIVGGICALVGLIVTSLTIPIISNNFNTYYDYAKEFKAKSAKKRK